MRRGLLFKAFEAQRPLVARMLAAPPVRARAAGETDFTRSSGDREGRGSFAELSRLGSRPWLVALDYFIHPIQIERAFEGGADAVLLIARLVDERCLARLVQAARALGVEPIVECATPEEAALAESLEVRTVAVSLQDRDNLRSFEIPPELITALERFDVRVAVSLERDTPAPSGFDAVFIGGAC